MKNKKIDSLDSIDGTLIIRLINKTNKKQKVNVFSLEDINKNVEIRTGGQSTYNWFMKVCLIRPILLKTLKIRSENTDFFLQEMSLYIHGVCSGIYYEVCLMSFLGPKHNQPKIIRIDDFNYKFDGLHEIGLTLLAKEEIQLIITYSPYPKDEPKKTFLNICGAKEPIYIENKTNKIQTVQLFNLANKNKKINKGVKIKSLYSWHPIIEEAGQLDFYDKRLRQFETLLVYSKNNPAQINQEMTVIQSTNEKELMCYKFKNNRTQDANLDFIDKFKFTYKTSINKYLEVKILPKTKVLYLFEIKEFKN